MLGKLFSLGAGSATGAMPSLQTSSQPPLPLESVQEDIRTRHLLFPDPQDLYEHRLNQLYPLSSGSSAPTGSSSNAFDYNADVELDVRDVRIIVMQDALSSVAASLLYDSQPPPPVPAASVDRPSATAGSYSVQEPRRTPVSPRKPSLGHAHRPIVIQSGSPQIRQAAFDRRPSVPNHGFVESEAQRAWREYREELATFSSCIFGNSDLMAYKGTSTKVHVVPSDARATENASILGDGRGSIGRSTMRASRLSHSFSSENPAPFTAPPTAAGPPRIHDRRKVLITRLFPVNLPLDDDTASLQGAFQDTTGYPFPQTEDDMKPTRQKKFQPRQKRTPMYAVALVISLPPAPAQFTPTSTLRPGFKGSSSYAEQDSFPSSFGSARRSGWTLIGQGPFGPDSLETSFGSEMEDQIDAITRHWDIIMRTLSHLQSAAAASLLTMLRQADLASPDPLPAFAHPVARAGSSGSSWRSEDGPPVKAPPKSNAKHITLLPNCLLENRNIGAEIDAAKARIVAGIRASRVTTGQNRWPIWREEARWAAKWAGGREQGFFFFNLLTGFLATHTDWLQALSPPAYRRRYILQQQRGRVEEGSLIPARTVIVSDSKIAARRLVFLLAAFLPASQQLPSLRAHQPSTPASLGTQSLSPPSFVVPILKEESLRRKINRRTGTRMPSHSRNLSLQSQTPRAATVPASLAHLSMEGGHERRVSDAASIRTSQLPMRGSDAIMRKSSGAMTATITHETSIPHFSTVSRAEIFEGRRGSSSSVAADDLKRLTRADSSGSQASATAERRQSSRWSVISGLWNPRRRDSTSKAPGSSDRQNGSPSSSAKAEAPAPATKPLLVSDATGGSGGEQPQPGGPSGNPASSPRGPTPPPPASAVALGPSDRGPDVAVFRKPQRTPDPSGAFESPVKTSININDGVIDVDVPLPDFVTSFESAVSSPSSSGCLSASGFGTVLDAFEQSLRFSADGDAPVNVAGWLQQYHPDFVLQALTTQQHDLIGQVRASMRAEPTPPSVLHEVQLGAVGKWVDVTSAIVADTTTFAITRIRYRRLVKVRQPGAVRALASSSAAPSPHEVQLREEFIEEPVVAFDDVLVEAVERVVAAAGTEMVGKVSSAGSSRSASKRRERSNSLTAPSAAAAAAALGQSAPAAAAVHSHARHHHHHHHHQPGLAVPQEVPRSQCKMVLLSALEDIIHDVIAEREQEQKEDRQRRGDGGASVATARARERERERESPLRQAVRGWIENVDLVD